MRWLKLALAAGTSLLAMTASAFADPISIGFALWSTVGAVLPGISFGAFVTAAQIGIYAAGIGLSLLPSVLAGKPRIDPGKYKNTFEETEVSEINAIGRVELGGLKAFGNTNAYNRYRLIWHAKGPLVRIEQYKLGAREVTVESNGQVSSPPFAKPGGSWVAWLTKPGNGTETAWPQLISSFPSLWTSSHRCRGVAQSLVQYVSPGFTDPKFVKLYQQGEPPATIVARMNTAYDPRDGAQSKTNDATWKWTQNGILCAVRIMLSYPDLTVDDFDWTDIGLEATKADALVATKTGTEPRARCSGVWESEAKRGDTMQTVLESIGAEIVLSDSGLIRIRLIDDAPSAEIQFTAAHQTEFSWKSGPDAVERPNVCKVKYYSAELGYTLGEIDMTGIGWARIDDEVVRYGEKLFTVELPFCPSASQAQRIARRLFRLARADTGVIKTNMTGLAAWGLTYADIEDADAEETMLCRMAPPRVDDQAGEVEIPFAVWPSLPAWSPSTDEAAAPEQIPDIQYESALDAPAAPAEYAQVQYPGGAYELRTRFASVTGGVTAEATWREYDVDGVLATSSMTEYAGSGATWYAYDAANAIGKHADFRCRFYNIDDEGSYYSDPLDVPTVAISNTATGAPATVATPMAGVSLAITVAELRAVKLVAEYDYDGSGWTVHTTLNDVRPGIPRTIVMDGFSNSTPIDKTMSWRVASYTSNGTRGTYASGSVTIPGNPP